MSYLKIIRMAFITFPLIAVLFTIPFLLYLYHRYTSINPFRVLIIYSFILYLITIYFLVILPLPKINEVMKLPNMIRLNPFNFVIDILKDVSFSFSKPSTYLTLLQSPAFYTVIFNILMFIPLGMYLRYYFQASLKKTMGLSFLLSLFLELTQLTGLYFIYPYPYRVFDTSDLLMNTLGGYLGYLIMGLFLKILPSREKIDLISYQKGEIVSGLRRIMIFFLDMFLYFFLTSFLNLFLKNKYFYIINFLLYYVIYPYFKNGKTLGSSFLKVNLKFKKHSFLNLLTRIIFLYFYYFGILYGGFLVINLVTYQLDNILIKISLYLGLFLIYLIFCLINIILLLKNKQLYYDKFFQVSYCNLIVKKS